MTVSESEYEESVSRKALYTLTLINLRIRRAKKAKKARRARRAIPTIRQLRRPQGLRTRKERSALLAQIFPLVFVLYTEARSYTQGPIDRI